MKDCSGLILTAAKADVTICEVFGNLPSGLVPVNGKPIIFFILQQFLDCNIKDVYIGVDYKSEKLKTIVDLYFGNKLNLHYVFTDQNLAPGNSLLTLLKSVSSKKVIINLGDTYIKGLKLSELDNEVLVSQDFLDEGRWATVNITENGDIDSFNNKKKVIDKNISVLSGVYCLNEPLRFHLFNEQPDNLQIVDLLKYYHDEVHTLTIKKTDSWLDFGHIDKYYISKKRLIQSRGFNYLEYDDLLGIVTKRSRNVEKFKAEIEWQVELPKCLKVLSPQILDYSLGDSPFISMEFYSYPTLSEIWLYSELNENIYFSIINKLFKILELFRDNQRTVTVNDYQDIYESKTLNRISEIKNRKICKLLELDSIHINGRKIDNWNIIKENVFQKIKSLYNKDDNCLIHGDFCLSNILYDLRSGLVRLIDPRGCWGGSADGDIKYDVAKLRHSINSDYDYIVNDLFSVDVDDRSIAYKTYNSSKINVKSFFDEQISKYYNLDEIKLIEGLLFLSMIPLHSDYSQRQLVMYAKSLELFNEVLK